MSVKRSSSGIIAALRTLMRGCGGEKLDAVVIPSGDHHQSEYSCASDEHRAYVTGFNGSAGTAVITHNHALLWTDGRYFLQATQQMDHNWSLMKDGQPDTPTIGKWLSKTLPNGSLIGIDPWIYSAQQWSSLEQQVKTKGHKLIPVKENLVNKVWEDRPNQTNNPVMELPIKYSGESWLHKVESLRKTMKDKEVDVVILTALDDIAWLYNLRGSDIPYNPVFFSFAAVTDSQAVLFIDESKLSDVSCLQEGEVSVSIKPYDGILSYISRWLESNSGVVWVNKQSSYAVYNAIPDLRRFDEGSPVQLMKAVKNKTEVEGMKNAHIRDAAAVCRYLHWLQVEVPSGKVTEISGSDKLQNFREQQDDFVGLSFATISAVGSNGSIIHYKSNSETNREITLQDLYLVDSGAQFKDGTTDITRTVHLGAPTDHEKECFTRVLKGHIDLAMAIFPDKTKGNQLDSFARKSLWDVGLDYLHGTGHGIGSYLNVHEGPMGIGKRVYPDDPGLQAGMFLSDEPGYYEDGKFGIRIESIVLVKEVSTGHGGKFLGFEVVTLVPIQRKLIVAELLTAEEVDWLNTYHAQCRELVGPLLQNQDEKAYKWLLAETQPLG